MRIMIVDPLFSTLPYDRALCTALVQQGHEVTMLARSRLAGEEWNPDAGNHEVLQIADVFSKSALAGWRLKLRTLARHTHYALQIQGIARLAKRNKADVVHFQWCLTPLAESVLVRRLRRRAVVVLTVHDTTPFNGSKVSSLLTLGMHRLMRSADRLIVHTQDAAEKLVSRGILAERVSVVPHGLLQTTGQRKQRTLTSVKTETNEKVHFLLFGHVKHYKGTDILIRAAALLSDEAKAKVKFVVAGQLGLPTGDLERLCEQQQVTGIFQFDFRFLTDQEADSAMRRADAFVFPYREIQASGVFTIALQYGRPVVASDIGIFRDYVRDSVNGYLVPPEDPLKLAKALELIITKDVERDRMGRASEKVAKMYPNWAEIAKRTVETYTPNLD